MGWCADCMVEKTRLEQENMLLKRQKDEAYRALVDIRDGGRTAEGQSAASQRAQAALDAISEMSAPSQDQAHGSPDLHPEGPTPEAGYQSLLRETAGERLGATK